jgi:hypothetical protein
VKYPQDIHTARCRLSPLLFQQHNLLISSILFIKIIVPPSSSPSHSEEKERQGDNVEEGEINLPVSFSVLCIAMPYTDNDYEDHEIIIDDSVMKGKRINWTCGTCEVRPFYISFLF